MECKEIETLIPWWLNGTLDSNKARTVEDHLVDCQACRRQLSEVQWAGRMFAVHPEVRFLVDLGFDREIEPEERRSLETHLSFCAECSEDLASIRSSREALTSTETGAIVDGDAKTTSSGSLEAGAAGSEGGEVVSFRRPTRSTEPSPGVEHRPVLRWLAAAGLITALLGAGGWWSAYRQLDRERSDFQTRIAALEDQLTTQESQPGLAPDDSDPADNGAQTSDPQEDRSVQLAGRLADREAELGAARQRIEALQASALRPRLNTPVIDLYSETTVRRSAPGLDSGTEGDTAANRVEIPSDADLVTLILVPDPGTQGAWTGVRLRDPLGREIWSLDGLLTSAAGDYTVTLPTSALPGPTALLELFGEGGRLERYPLEIQRR